MPESTSDSSLLVERARRASAERLSTDPRYNQKEIKEVAALSHRLVPRGLTVDERTAERLRALARLSQTELRAPIAIRSHRRFIGPLIVSIKRALWPLLHALLKDFVDAQREFNSLLLEEYLCHLNSAEPVSAGGR